MTVAATLVSFTALGVTLQAIGLAALATIFLLSLVLNAYLWKESRDDESHVKQIAFLTPSTGDQPFYSSMLTGLVRSASLALGQNYVVIPSMPTQNFEAVSIWALFASLEDRQLSIDGIFFIPDDPDGHFDELVGFHETRGDIPLVLVDVYFDLDACDARTKNRLPSFVGGDENAGGLLAANLMIDAIASLKGTDSRKRVLIVNGGTAPWEMQRAAAFRERMASEYPGVEFLETEPIPYSRSRAFEAVLDVVHRYATEDGAIGLDGIFACNDDMAIGARGAISRLHREGISFAQPPQIVGYDGIPEIREYLASGDPYIAGSVDVRINEQARVAMALMQKLIRAGMPSSEIRLVTPGPLQRGATHAKDTEHS